MRSRSGRPDAWYFLAIDTTSRRFDCTNVRCASSPSRAVRRSSRFLVGVRLLPPSRSSPRAALPNSICCASRTSSSFVRRGYCPMSVRYRRTRSSSSRSTRSFATGDPLAFRIRSRHTRANDSGEVLPPQPSPHCSCVRYRSRQAPWNCLLRWSERQCPEHRLPFVEVELLVAEHEVEHAHHGPVGDDARARGPLLVDGDERGERVGERGAQPGGNIVARRPAPRPPRPGRRRRRDRRTRRRRAAPARHRPRARRGTRGAWRDARARPAPADPRPRRPSHRWCRRGASRARARARARAAHATIPTCVRAGLIERCS